MKSTFKILWRLIAVGLFLAPFIVTMLAIEREPLVSENEDARFDDIADARGVLKRFDPRTMSSDAPTEVSVTAPQVSMAVGAVLSKIPALRGRVDAGPDGVTIDGTAQLPIPETFLGRYLNVTATVAPSESGLELSELRVGALSIPVFLVRPTAIFLLDWFLGDNKGTETYESIRAVRVKDDVITVTFLPPANLFADVRDAAKRITRLDNAEVVRTYYRNLIETGRTAPRDASLSTYLRPAFALAKERSAGNDPVEENRALILALAIFFGDHRFAALMHNVRTPDIVDDVETGHVTVQNRHDWVQHFTTSAGLQVASNSGLSDLIGVAKEVNDAQGGSGFSFGDLAADRAGVRLAEVATASAASARRVQDTLSGAVAESAFFPKAHDLPEDMEEEDFKARYGDVNTAAYDAQVRIIDKRIAAIELYR